MPQAASKKVSKPAGKVVKNPVQKQIKAIKLNPPLAAGFKNLSNSAENDLVMASTSRIQNYTEVPALKLNQTIEEKEENYDELLASLVMDQPNLYDFHLPSNKGAGEKAEKWRDICEEIKRGKRRITLHVSSLMYFNYTFQNIRI